MDEKRRKELQALKDKYFFGLIADDEKYVGRVQSLLATIKLDIQSNQPLSGTKILEICDEAEDSIVKIYVNLDIIMERIKRIQDKLDGKISDDDDDEGDASLPLPIPK